jgi:hypothetical protein
VTVFVAAARIGKPAIDLEGVRDGIIFERRLHDLDEALGHPANGALDDQPDIVVAFLTGRNDGSLDDRPV